MSSVSVVDDAVAKNIVDAASANNQLNALKQVLLDLLGNGMPVVVPSDFYNLSTSWRAAEIYELVFVDPRGCGFDPADVRDLTALVDKCTYDLLAAVDYQTVPEDSPQRSRALSFILANDYSEVCGVYRGVDEAASLIRISNHHVSAVVLLLPSAHVARTLSRRIIEQAASVDEVFERYAGTAFPSLHIRPDLRPSDLSVDLNMHGTTIVTHLSFLADDYISLGNKCSWDLPKMCDAAKAHGVDLSDESSKTKQDKKKIAQRQVQNWLGKGVLDCTLHTKIEPTRGRIHFCTTKIDGEQSVVIGIFHEHLDI